MGRLVILIGAGVCLALGPRGARAQVVLEAEGREVQRCDRIEFTIQAQPAGENPYDPDEARIDLACTAPNGKKIAVPAFYYQPYEREAVSQGRREQEWLYPVGAAQWKARFAPTQTGRYSCQAIVTDRAGARRSNTLTFQCTPGKSRGYLHVSEKDRRFFAFDDGTPFFAIGQNVAFVRDVYETEEIFRKLGEQGANFARVWCCGEDWAMAIEARKSAWGRSWGWKPPVVPAPGRDAGYHSDGMRLQFAGETGKTFALSPTAPIALRAATKYTLSGSLRADQTAELGLEIQGVQNIPPLGAGAEWRRFEREFSTKASQRWLPRIAFRLKEQSPVWLRDLSLREAAGGPELLEEAQISRPARGHYNQRDCFMLDKVVEAAERHGLYLELTLLTRNHYMRDLGDANGEAYARATADAKNLLRYAVGRWGYSTHVAIWEYFNEMDPGKPTDRFYAELGDYLERSDPWRHLRTTSDWSPSPKTWAHPRLDLADMHYYMRPSTGALYKDAVESVRQRTAFLLKNTSGKPALFSEFGITGDNWQLNEDFKKDVDYVHLHNGLWASAFSGTAGTVMSWFWEELENRNAYHRYGPLARFLKDENFPAPGMRKAEVRLDIDRLRAIGQRDGARAWLWISDKQSTWWTLGVEQKTPGEIIGATLTLAGLAPGEYHVEWWDTWKGEKRSTERIKVAGPQAQLKPPRFSRDIACKIRPATR